MKLLLLVFNVPAKREPRRNPQGIWKDALFSGVTSNLVQAEVDPVTVGVNLCGVQLV